jgi:hypothetical protein
MANIFNKVTVPNQRANKATAPALTITSANVLSFNEPSKPFLKGKHVQFEQSEKDPQDWIITVHKDGFELREKDSYLMLSHSALALTIKKSFECPKDWSMGFNIVERSKGVWFLAKNRDNKARQTRSSNG